MRFMVGGMMVAFALGGVSLIVSGLRELAAKISRRHRFETATGTIEGVKRKVLTSMHKAPLRSTVMNFPIVAFTTRAGEPVTFTAETGDSGDVSRYEQGQKIVVRYDPAGEFPPMLDDWFGVWMPPVMIAFGGCVFLAGSALIYVAFGDKILGR